jgi:F-type H+-transporting ATPase subunit delta
MRTVSTGVARRYARALLDVALRGDRAEPTLVELQRAVALVRERPELERVLRHPAVAADKKKRIVASVFTEARASRPVGRLLALLAERGRFECLPAVEAAYLELWNEHRQVATAEVVTAVPLAAAARRDVASALEKVIGLKVEARERVDASLIGGVVVIVGGKTYDGSVRGRLRALRQRLASGAAT